MLAILRMRRGTLVVLLIFLAHVLVFRHYFGPLDPGSTGESSLSTYGSNSLDAGIRVVHHHSNDQRILERAGSSSPGSSDGNDDGSDVDMPDASEGGSDGGSDAGSDPGAPPEGSKSFDDYTARGQAYDCVLALPTIQEMTQAMVAYKWLQQGQSPQSPFAQYSDLAANGYSKDADDADLAATLNLVDDPPISNILHAIGLNPDGTLTGDNTMVQWKHNRQVTIAGTVYQPTGADFTDIYNPTGGAIIRKYNYGTQYNIDQKGLNTKPPPLSKWSDAVFLEYAAQAQSQGKQVSELRYIFCVVIRNDITEWLIANALDPATSNWQTVQAPAWGSKKVLTMDHSDAQALLGSPHGKGVAWMLMNHRQQLGWKRVKSVTIFRDDSDLTAYSSPSLMFEIEDGNAGAA